MVEYNEQFWNNYNKHIENNPLRKNDYLIKDGYISDNYKLSKTKVLFILKESNESKKGEKDSNSVYEWFESHYNGKKTDKMITKMSKINKFINNYPSYDFKSINVSNKEAYDFSFINISKRGNGEKNCSTDLNKVLELDGEFIARQIKFINPDIIICGVKSVETKLNFLLTDKKIFDHTKIIYTNHFSIVPYKDISDKIIQILSSAN